MTDFTLTATVKPEIDRKAKKEIEEELEFTASGGGSGSGTSKAMKDLLNFQEDKLGIQREILEELERMNTNDRFDTDSKKSSSLSGKGLKVGAIGVLAGAGIGSFLVSQISKSVTSTLPDLIKDGLKDIAIGGAIGAGAGLGLPKITKAFNRLKGGIRPVTGILDDVISAFNGTSDPLRATVDDVLAFGRGARGLPKPLQTLAEEANKLGSRLVTGGDDVLAFSGRTRTLLDAIGDINPVLRVAVDLGKTFGQLNLKNKMTVLDDAVKNLGSSLKNVLPFLNRMNAIGNINLPSIIIGSSSERVAEGRGQGPLDSLIDQVFGDFIRSFGGNDRTQMALTQRTQTASSSSSISSVEPSGNASIRVEQTNNVTVDESKVARQLNEQLDRKIDEALERFNREFQSGGGRVR